LTEYARSYRAIRSAGADVVALSVDRAERSEALRTQLKLEFPILCDTERTVVRAWDLYNPREMGGIAVPAVFVIGSDRRVEYRSIDETAKRVSTDGVLDYLRGAATAPTDRVKVRARLSDFARALGNAIRRGVR
jgi:peroxiredoxin